MGNEPNLENGEASSPCIYQGVLVIKVVSLADELREKRCESTEFFHRFRDERADHEFIVVRAPTKRKSIYRYCLDSSVNVIKTVSDLTP